MPKPEPTEAPAAPPAPPPAPKPPKLRTLAEALTQAREALAVALRALIAARIPEGDAFRNATENAFEAAKNEVADRKPTLATLTAAVRQLQAVVTTLKNDSRTNPDHLHALGDAARWLAQDLERLAQAHG